MRALAVVALAACGGGDVAVAVATPKHTHAAIEPVDPIAVLAAPQTDHAWIVPGVAQLELDGSSTVAPRGGGELDVALLEENRDKVRVAVRTDTLAFAVWTERARLLGVLARDQIVSSRPGGDSSTLAMELRAGAHVRRLGRKDGWLEVRYLGGIEIDGWIPDDAVVDRVHTVAGLNGLLPQRPLLAVTHGAVIRDATSWSARQLAVVNNANYVDTIHEIDKAWIEVAYVDRDVRVHGFLDRTAPPGITHVPPDELVVSLPGLPAAIVSRGTCLYAAPDGEPIGFTVADQSSAQVEPWQPGWFRVALDTPWGPILFAVRGPAATAAEPCEAPR